jgi:SNF2 family DNA or RNA helicase
LTAFHPRAYQTPIIQAILENNRFNVWAPMGSGKTSAVLTAYETMRLAGAGPMLVLAPKRVALNTWPAEVLKWDHLRHLKVSPIIGNPKRRLAALNARADVYTINYDNLVWLCEQVGNKWPWEIVIADESSRLKSFRLGQGGVRARALGKVAHKHIKQFINLTGTPKPNGLQDLWGQQWFIDRGERLGRTFTAFEQRWFNVRLLPGGGKIVKPYDHAMKEIGDKLEDCTTSIDMRQHFDLKEPLVADIKIDLPPAIRAQYDRMEEEMFAQFEEDGIEAGHAATRTLKLLQIAAGSIHLEDGSWKTIHDEKLDALDSVIEELAGANLLLAYNFKTDLARVQKRFKARHLDANPQTIVDWNVGKIPLLAAHPASAGHGLNLQDGGHHLCFLNLWWNLENYLQIIERIGPVRQAQSGYDRPVFVYRIIARDTIEETLVAPMLEEKATMQEVLMRRMQQRRAK